MLELKNFHPVTINDLIRVGRDADGGYVLSKRQVENTETLLSFGINDDWSFEADFLTKKNAKLYAFDHSVSKRGFRLAFLFDSQNYLKFMFYNVFMGRISRVRIYYKVWKATQKLAKDFERFFDKNQDRFFIPKFVGEKNDERYIRLDTIFTDYLKNIPDFSVFIKMDVESWEYRTLPQLTPFFNKVNGLVVEFHDIDIAERKFQEIIDRLSCEFYIAHVHANNYDDFIHNTNFPKVLEITFINKSLVPGQIPPPKSSLKYPIEGLDFPCNSDLDDIALNFEKQIN
ncbi:MAG: hypothetical protein LBS25_06845 [Candidatus Symbiothrix sp.]|jgi:hypothetical protein|nr:hypothetical protein [Candidatus Symbiothrix sp.]